MRIRRSLCWFVLIALAFCFVNIAHAADDSQKLTGDWTCTIPINGQPAKFTMKFADGTVKVYYNSPTNEVLVRQAKFTAVDGQYKETDATLAPAVSCGYKFPSDDDFQAISPIGTVDWKRVKTDGASSSAAAAGTVDSKTSSATQTPAAQTPAATTPPAPASSAATPASPPSASTPAASTPAAAPTISGPTLSIDAGQALIVQLTTEASTKDAPDTLYSGTLFIDAMSGQTIAIPRGTPVFLKMHVDANGITTIVADHLHLQDLDIPVVAESDPLKTRPAGTLHANRRIDLKVKQAFNVQASTSAAQSTKATPAETATATATRTGEQSDTRPGPARSVQSDDAQKLSGSSPDELADCVVLDNDLVDLANGKTLATGLKQNAMHPVVGRNDLVFDGTSLFSINDLTKSMAMTPFGEGVWIAPDRRRVVTIENGDIWRAEFDWAHNAIANKKQVTTQGVFGAARKIAWCDNIILINAAISPEKPYARIDLLKDGAAIEQLPMEMMFDAKQATPDGRLIFGPEPGLIGAGGKMLIQPHPDQLHVFNVISGKDGYVSATAPVKFNGQVMKVLALDGFGKDDRNGVWIGDESAIVMGGGGIPFSNASPSLLRTLDFTTGSANFIASFPQSSNIYQVLPGKKFVDVIVGQTDTELPASRVLVNLADGSKTNLPAPPEWVGRWIDDDRLVWGVSKGDLNALGVFVYSRSTSKVTRISSRAAKFDQEHLVYVPHLDTIVFRSSDQALYRAKLDGTGLTKLTQQMVRPIETDPVDLGLGDNPKPAWQEVNYTPAQLALPTAGTAAAQRPLELEKRMISKSQGH